MSDANAERRSSLLRTRLGNGARKVGFLGVRRAKWTLSQAVGLSKRLLLRLFFGLGKSGFWGSDRKWTLSAGGLPI